MVTPAASTARKLAGECSQAPVLKYSMP
jgi:hypothetical protein